MKSALALALLALLPGARLTAAGVDRQAEREALFRLDAEWAQAAESRDVGKILSYWADRAQVFPPGQPPVVGKEALRRYVSDALAMPGFSMTWKADDFYVSESGDVAYGVGTNTVTLKDAEGRLVTEQGRAVTVWRKGPDGWKCVLDIWNAASSPSSPPAK
jgi:ketosteroid isomerase-like protein